MSFMQLRIHDDVPSMMQAPIAWEAPDYIRKCSLSYNIYGTGCFYPEVDPDFRLMDHIRIIDYANVEFDMWDSEAMARQAIPKIGDIVKAGAVPLVFGGDHSIPYPVMRGISDNTEGKTGIIWFDRHYDNDYGGRAPRPYNTFSRLNAGNAMYRILASCDVDVENICLISIGGINYNTLPMGRLAKEIGLTVFTDEDVRRKGMAEVISQALEVSTKGTERIYITLDTDVMDPVTFPAQKYPEPMGISFQNVMQALEIITRDTNVAGMDLCCMGPGYDVRGVGGLCACRFYIEILKGLALKKAK